MEDFYCDGDAAPLGRLNYIFQNYIPGVSEIRYEEPTTAPVTSESPETTPRSETDASEGGCTSIAGYGTVLILTAAMAILLKKKEI
jgi:hypothetical protein